MESSLFSDTLFSFPSFSKPQLLPIPTPSSPNLPISVNRRSFSITAAALKMDSKEVKLWGGRFEDSVTDAVEKFTESISFDKDLYKHDIMGSRAHACMLARQGLITEDDRTSILKGLDEIEGQIERGEFVWRTDREDVHMNIEAALTDLVGEPAKKLHTARSRNDQVCTDFRLWCRDAIDNIVLRVKQLQAALLKLAMKNEGVIVPGYTHLQRAQPVLLQHLILAYVEQLERDAGRLLDCRERMNVCPLGACALAGTGLPIDRFMTSEALGFVAPMRNSIDAVSDRDFVLEFLSANSITAIHLSRLGEEWVLWASEEFGFLTPSDSVSTGSSIMPQKKNPDPMELVRGKSARVIGDLVSLIVLCKGLPHAYNPVLQLVLSILFLINIDYFHVIDFLNIDFSKFILYCLVLVLEQSLLKTSPLIIERIQKALPAGHLDATTLADYLVMKIRDII
ncbi:argininosuccinate lyase, chloroplastic-like [Dorcoceras hygrometricum]|uniref:Argininosuccinate lyase, chloroplastic-like n=1 Tax=Dorcoceras hygrometricum TaxID=472368 RepID=A0A2Z7CRA2_9LAMI|nr:argininosuccinate lyase, chloroplastic-like [Dorcoceras hygrometricum]